MRKTISVAALLLALMCPAYAGDMPNFPPAPPQTASTNQVPATDGEMQNDAADILTQTALDVLAVLPSLF
jgi:hypothetical protein